MDDLVTFLTARLDEDEAVAKAASKWHESPWRTNAVTNEPAALAVRSYDDGVVASPVLDVAAAHIARHDPARVLREVEAKRRIVEDWKRWRAEEVAAKQDYVAWIDERAPREAPRRILDPALGAGLEYALRTLAVVYSDHPDYRDEWRP